MLHYEEEDLDLFLDNTQTIALNKRGQPRRRKPKEPRVYFTTDTEEAIIEYLSSQDQNFRNKIYKDRIEYAFYKLAENIIHTFKFYYTDSDTIEELKHEVVTFLLEKLLPSSTEEPPNNVLIFNPFINTDKPDTTFAVCVVSSLVGDNINT